MSSVYSNYIKRMRMCANENCEGCTYQYEGLTNTEECKEDLLYDAAEQLEDADKCNARLVKKCKEMEKRIAKLESWAIHLLKQMPKEGEWIMDENPHDGDCRCSVCLVAIDAMHERNHGLLNALTGGKWWTFYRYCPNCGAKMKGENDEQIH